MGYKLPLVVLSLLAVAPTSALPSFFKRESKPRLSVAVDVGTESLRVAVFDEDGVVVGSATEAHETFYPAPGRAEQVPDAWWHNLGVACKRAVGDRAADVAALCLATTSCTVVACDAAGAPLRDCLLWMDARSATEAEDILEMGAGDPALRVNSGGAGPISAEWMLPKALWLKRHEPETWDNAAVVCECQDWLNFKLTGGWAAGGSNVATRWHCDGALAVAEPPPAAGPFRPFGGRPSALLAKIGLADLEDKWPMRCVATGAAVGTLTKAAAAHLGLPRSVVVAQGGADAFVGIVGAGCATAKGGVVVVTGSSHLHLACGPLRDLENTRGAPSCWGGYRGAPLPSLTLAEGGQSSTGSALRLASRLLGDDDLKALDELADGVPVGCEGLSALETLQGARTPVCDPHARGALVGLSLAHGKAHVWRAALEAVCLGTRNSLEGLSRALKDDGDDDDAPLHVCGGATKSEIFLQMHADACGRAVVVGENPDAPLLGAAVLAFAALDRAARPKLDVERAVESRVKRMVRPKTRLEPRPYQSAAFDRLDRRVRSRLAPAVAPISRACADLAAAEVPADDRPRPPRKDLPGGLRPVVAPSLLAADPANLADAARAALSAGATWLHVDVFDGSKACGGALSNMGPGTVSALRAALGPDAFLDVHAGVRHLDVEAYRDASQLTFQFEAVDEPVAACKQIRALGLRAGVCVAPSTPADALDPLLDAGLVDLVDVLFVEPGRGGQDFNEDCLEKLRHVRARAPGVDLMADGGIHETTAYLAAAAGANVLVAGTFCFRDRGRHLEAAVDALHAALAEGAGHAHVDQQRNIM